MQIHYLIILKSKLTTLVEDFNTTRSIWYRLSASSGVIIFLFFDFIKI